MLVKDFVEDQLALKPYKYQTKINILRCLKKLDFLDMEYEKLTALGGLGWSICERKFLFPSPPAPPFPLMGSTDPAL